MKPIPIDPNTLESWFMRYAHPELTSDGPEVRVRVDSPAHEMLDALKCAGMWKLVGETKHRMVVYRRVKP